MEHKDGAPPWQIGYIDFRNPIGSAAVDPAAMGGDAGAAQFRLQIELLPTREIVATNLQTGQQFGMVLDKLQLKPEDNPFSGIF